MRDRIHWRRRLVLLAGAACLAAAAPAAHAQSQPNFKIGFLTDLNSAYSDITGKGSVAAAELALEDFGPTVLGRKIEMIVADNQAKPDISSAIASRWYDDQGVSAIFDVPITPVSIAVQTVARERPSKAVIFTGPASSDLAGKFCAENSIHWSADSYAMAYSVARAMAEAGGKNWYFLTADNAAGPPLTAAASAAIDGAGGKVLGESKFPFNSPDLSSYMLQAQASKAQVIGLASGGNDTINFIKLGHEFGVVQSGVKLATLTFFISDVHAMGLQLGQGIVYGTAFYWDLNEKTRAFSKRFFAKVGRMPTQQQAGAYGGIMHYLNAVKATGSDDAKVVIPAMKKTPVNDFMTENGRIREDGRLVRTMYLAQVKAPSESKYDWDYVKIVGQVPPEQAFLPLDKSPCPLVKK